MTVYVKFLVPCSALFNDKKTFCPCCGPVDNWGTAGFLAGEEENLDLVNVSHLEEGKDFEFVVYGADEK